MEFRDEVRLSVMAFGISLPVSFVVLLLGAWIAPGIWKVDHSITLLMIVALLSVTIGYQVALWWMKRHPKQR